MDNQTIAPFHLKTPLIRSAELSFLNSDAKHETNVFLKLENSQPSGSYKIRGIGHMICKVN